MMEKVPMLVLFCTMTIIGMLAGVYFANEKEAAEKKLLQCEMSAAAQVEATAALRAEAEECEEYMVSCTDAMMVCIRLGCVCGGSE